MKKILDDEVKEESKEIHVSLEERLLEENNPNVVSSEGFLCANSLYELDFYFKRYLQLITPKVRDEADFGKVSYVTGDLIGASALTEKYLLLAKKEKKDIYQSVIELTNKYVLPHKEIMQGVIFSLANSSVFTKDQLKSYSKYLNENLGGNTK